MPIIMNTIYTPSLESSEKFGSACIRSMSSDGVYIVFLCIGIIGYFTIPTVAGWIIQAGGMGGYGRNVNQMAGRAGSMAGSVAGAAAGNAVGRVGKLLK